MGSAFKPPIVHLVDDDEQFQIAIARLLRAAGYGVHRYVSAGDFLVSYVQDSPGCILLDVCMPGPSGLDLQAALVEREIPLPIIFLSGRSDIPSAVKAIQSGAIDFLTKPVERVTLLRAIENALSRYEAERGIQERLATTRTCYQSLSPRELEVFKRITCGKRNRDIAIELNIAERTVKAHRARIMEKMEVNSLAELVHISGRLIDAGVFRMDMQSVG